MIPLILNKNKEVSRPCASLVFVDFCDDKLYKVKLDELLSMLNNEKNKQQEKVKNEEQQRKINEDRQFILDSINAMNTFNARFAKTFPGVRGLIEYTERDQIENKLKIFFELPVPEKIWWFRGASNMPISSFEKRDDKFILDVEDELIINKIAAYHGFPIHSFLYIESTPD